MALSFSGEAAAVLKNFGTVGGPAAPSEMTVVPEGLSLKVGTIPAHTVCTVLSLME